MVIELSGLLAQSSTHTIMFDSARDGNESP